MMGDRMPRNRAKLKAGAAIDHDKGDGANDHIKSATV